MEIVVLPECCSELVAAPAGAIACARPSELVRATAFVNQAFVLTNDNVLACW